MNKRFAKRLAKLNFCQRYEILSRIYDRLYDKAVKLIEKNNYCQVSCGNCIFGRLSNKNGLKFCCGGCRYLGKTGCKAQALTCRAHFCGVGGPNPEHIYELEDLNNKIRDFGFWVFRGTKFDSIYQSFKLIKNNC